MLIPPIRSKIVFWSFLGIIFFTGICVAFYFGKAWSSFFPSQIARLICDMRGGAMNSLNYVFVIDAARKTVNWADYDMPMEVIHISDQRIHTNVKMQLSGFPEHSQIAFNFNRITLVVEGSLLKEPTSAVQERCRQTVQSWDCSSTVVDSSAGVCRIVNKQF